jgi:Biotin-lipoyl like
MAESLFKDDRPASDAAPPDRKSIPRDESFDKLKEPAKRASFGRRLLVIAILAILVIAAAIAGRLWWLHARNFESTDDAFVDTRIAGISSQVSGAIAAVPVTDNELVAKGATLIDIDPRDYQVAVAQAQAQVAQAQAQVAQANATVANLDAQLDAQKARIDQTLRQVEQTKAALTFAQQEHDRNQDLMRNNAGTRQQLQQGPRRCGSTSRCPDIYFGDAAHMRSDHHAGRTWGKRGETPVVLSTGARHRMSLISAVTSRGHMRFMIKELPTYRVVQLVSLGPTTDIRGLNLDRCKPGSR